MCKMRAFSPQNYTKKAEQIIYISGRSRYLKNIHVLKKVSPDKSKKMLCINSMAPVRPSTFHSSSSSLSSYPRDLAWKLEAQTGGQQIGLRAQLTWIFWVSDSLRWEALCKGVSHPNISTWAIYHRSLTWIKAVRIPLLNHHLFSAAFTYLGPLAEGLWCSWIAIRASQTAKRWTKKCSSAWRKWP